MNPDRAFDRAVEQLEQELADGLISQEDFRKELRELQRDHHGAAEEAARAAYEAELHRWF